MDKFRHITLANFQFKILTKVLANRLNNIRRKIVSEQQRSFIKGRKIQEYILIESEALNLLDRKGFGGDLAMKIYVKKSL